LGEGGMGAVYEARHLGTGRRLAVKLIVGEALAKSADIIRRFQREAMATGAIESQYIAHALDTGVDPVSRSPYLVMDLLNGEDVQRAIRRIGAMPPDLALRIAAQACLGLQRAHEAGVVHRDIKPANLFLARREGREVIVKILDFGIAKVKLEELSASPGGADMTRTGAMLGSPLYMSPEQARGKKTIDHRTDLWSLGIVLYEALTGTTPNSDAETVGELILQICSREPRSVQDLAPWVRPEVAAIVQRATTLDPAARFPSAGAMFEAIQPLLPGGHALDDSMFTSVPAEFRRIVAPRSQTVSGLQAPAVSAVPATPPASSERSANRASTTAGLAQSRGGAVAGSRRSRIVLWGTLGGFLTLGIVGGELLLRQSPPVTNGPASASSTPLSAAIPPPPPPPVAPAVSVPVVSLSALPVQTAAVIPTAAPAPIPRPAPARVVRGPSPAPKLAAAPAPITPTQAPPPTPQVQPPAPQPPPKPTPAPVDNDLYKP
ncbi:MAG: serine/threonine-protein kinase, partial [Polyangiaceae bacterium]